jgi:hypothetical protein
MEGGRMTDKDLKQRMDRFEDRMSRIEANVDLLREAIQSLGAALGPAIAHFLSTPTPGKKE